MLSIFDDIDAELRATRARLADAAKPKAPTKRAAKAAAALEAKAPKHPRATAQPLAEAERAEAERATPKSKGCHWHGCTLAPTMWLVAESGFTAKFCGAHGATQHFRFKEHGIASRARALTDTPTTT